MAWQQYGTVLGTHPLPACGCCPALPPKQYRVRREVTETTTSRTEYYDDSRNWYFSPPEWESAIVWTPTRLLRDLVPQEL